MSGGAVSGAAVSGGDPCRPHPGSIAFYMHDLSGGGVERMRLLLIEALRARGRDVMLIVQSDRGPLKALLPPGLPLFVLGCRSTWSSIPALVRFIRAHRPDMLVASLDHNNIAALLARPLSRVATRVVVCQHNALSAELTLGWRYRIVPFLYRLLHRNAAAIVAVSDGVADDLAAIAGIDRGRITTIFNPVIDERFHLRAASACPHPWFTDRSRPVFVFAGRLSPQKDPHTLIEAFALVHRAMPARLLILGDGPLRDELERMVRRLGIAACVDFAGFHANPLPWLARASALVLSSRYEGLGNVIIEALACGTPIVSTDCPFGPAEILANGRFGVLAAPGDPQALAAAMRLCLEVRWDRMLLRERGARFSAAAAADEHLALFERIGAGSCSTRQRQVFGLTLSGRSAAETVDDIMAEPARSVGLIVTPNLDHLRLLRKPLFAQAYSSATLCCPDGMPILLYARLRGLRLRGRVTGCELFHRLAAHPRLDTQNLVIVAESRDTEQAVARWAERIGLPGRIRAVAAPPGLLLDVQAQAALVQAIAAHAPSILVVTLGAPTSEIFVHLHRAALPPCWVLCIGQAVRVELGLTPRAPLAWQALGLEWLWRLGREPRRLAGRYIGSALWLPVAIAIDLLGWMAPRTQMPRPDPARPDPARPEPARRLAAQETRTAS